MHINRIRLNNFKSIYDELDINFDDMKGFWKISGAVGSGKTSIGEAIIFGLYGSISGKNNSDLISWGQKHGCVELWCNSKGYNIYIKREINSYGQSPIYIEINGEELDFSNKRNSQEKLESDYYDTSRMTIELLCIISFNNFKSLASLNTSDSKKFLDQILGFSILSEYADACKYLKSEDSKKLNECEYNLHGKKEQVDKLKELSNIEIIDGDINEVNKTIEDLRDSYKTINEKCQPKLNELSTIINNTQSEITGVVTLGKNKNKEIEFIKKGICPTCGAHIDKSHLKEKMLEKDILSDKYRLLNNIFIHTTEQYNKLNDELRPKLDSINNEIRDNQILLTRLEEQRKRKNVNTKEIENIEREIQVIKEDYDSLLNNDTEWEELRNILTNDLRSSILDNFIPILNENIQQYAQSLQLPYIIQFDNKFKCKVSIYGLNDKIPISSLSTGQLKIVDMIVILGILGTILGSGGINIIFLDELFSNLDNELRDNVCTILKKSLPKDKTIFIISHQEIDSRIFDGHINLKLENNNQFERKTKFNIVRHESI